MKKAQMEAIVNNDTNEIDDDRNFTKFLNNWGALEEKL